MSSKKKGAIVFGVVAIIAVIGIAGYFAINKVNKQSDMHMSKVENLMSESEEEQLDEKINEAIDAYLIDFAKKSSFSDIMTAEDKSAIGKDILMELSKDMTDEELTHMKKILVELFSDNSTLTITGSAYFTDETRAYITSEIKEAVIAAMSGDSKEGTEGYEVLKTTVERIVTENIGTSNIGYSLTGTDIDTIKQSVLSSLGNVRGEAGANGKDGHDGKDGANGKDGEDGRDGRDGHDGKDGNDGHDGKDGYTPVKGTDYFTDSEVNTILNSVTTHLEKYVDDTKPVKGIDYYTEAEIGAITAAVRNSVMDIVENSKEDMSDMLGTGESRENSNQYTSQETYKKGDVIVKDGNIYICKDDIDTPESFNEAHWEATDLVSINNYYNEYFTQSITEVTEKYDTQLNEITNKYDSQLSDATTKYESGITELDERLTEATNKAVEDLEKNVDEKLSEVKNQATGTLSRVQSLEDNQASFKLINNGDGTYTLQITDPKN